MVLQWLSDMDSPSAGRRPGRGSPQLSQRWNSHRHSRSLVILGNHWEPPGARSVPGKDSGSDESQCLTASDSSRNSNAATVQSAVSECINVSTLLFIYLELLKVGVSSGSLDVDVVGVGNDLLLSFGCHHVVCQEGRWLLLW